MDTKLHFKLFKDGKNWCVMGIATLAMAVGLGAATLNAHADTTTTNVQPQVTLASMSSRQAPATNTQQTTTPTNSTSTNSTTNNNQQSNVDYQTPVNDGHLDGASADSHGNVVFTGWHATNKYQQGMHHFIIALNGDNNQELYRTEAQTVARPDVARVYPHAPIAENGGFSVNIPASRIEGVNSVRLVSRYTTNANGESSANGTDFWYNPVTTNAGWLDTFRVDGNKVVVSGWHASDASANEPNHFLILFDRTVNHEVARQIVTNHASDDVARAGYATVANGANARFSASFDITPAMIGHQFALVSRYSDSNNVNNYGHYTDYWFNNGPRVDNQNQAWLDNFSVQGNKIVASGWNANEMSAAYPHHFLILFDRTKNHEVARQIVTDQNSSDVARVYGNIYNAANSRFSATFDVTPQMMGDTFVLVSRYSDSSNVNNYGNYSDYWFNNNQVNLANKQAAWLDQAMVNPNNSTVTFSGWHAADASAVLPYHYAILFDRTANREVARQEVATTNSNDVARVHGDIANANKSRFSVTFHVTPSMIGHQFVLVSRYSDNEQTGEGNRVDNWFNNNVVNLNDQQAYLDTFTENGNSVHAAGWHVADASVTQPHHFLILWDATTNSEIGRIENLNDSTDLPSHFPQIFNANHARFDVTFNIPANRRNDALQIISRYSNDANGNGQYTDIWIPQWLNLYQNPSWMYQINYTQIQPQGPVGYNVGVGYEGIKTWFIKRALGTAGGYNQFSNYDAALVANVQRQHGLPATGVVDLNTWRALGYSPDLWYSIDSYVAPLGAHAGQGRQAHIEAMINQAYQYMGKPYLVGSSSSPAYGTDCSGLVMQALYAGGINPTSCSSIYHAFPGNEWNSRQLFSDPHFRTVPYWQRQRGDLVFYYEPGTNIIYHVAIYLGNDQVIESWPPRIMISNIAAGYHPSIAAIRRVFN